MAIWKEIWTFQSGTATWSEVYYSVASTIKDAATFDTPFLNKRLALLDKFNILRKIRVSAVAGIKQSFVAGINRNGLFSSAIDVGPANVTEAVVCNLVSTVSPASRRLWLRGTNEEFVKRLPGTGQDFLWPNFAAWMKVWFQALDAANYIILKRLKDGEGGVVTQKVNQVNGAAADGTTVITCQGNVGVNTNDMVTLAKFNTKDLPGLNGNFKVLEVAGNTFKVQYSTPGNETFKTSTGTAKKLAFSELCRISGTVSNFNFLGGRKTKNVSTGSRGARPARRVRTLVSTPTATL